MFLFRALVELICGKLFGIWLLLTPKLLGDLWKRALFKPVLAPAEETKAESNCDRDPPSATYPEAIASQDNCAAWSSVLPRREIDTAAGRHREDTRQDVRFNLGGGRRRKRDPLRRPGDSDNASKYEFPSDNLASGPTDPDLTIEDMATKSEILKKLQCNLLPAIKEQITSLLKSINDLDEEYPRPDILQATVSSILTIADEAPLPDKKHDHRLGKLKSFRCSQLRSQIKSIVGSVAEHLLECYGTFMKCCTMAILVADPSLAWQEASKSKQSIRLMTAGTLDSIDRTISWSLRSDWDIVRRDWSMAVGEINDLLET
ncbi:hypothetical protein H4Q26_003876 [Puccinia striiformis f. sp. tritici PST-130]|nr:hypothetical protein H4Q26_003876 [Puccinia striiformis f. sp. tritici PST-130]